MQDTDKRGFMAKLMMVAEYYQQTLSKPVIDLWWSEMAPYELADFSRAIEAHIKTSHFMPRISNVVEFIDGTGEERSMRSWTEVRQAVRDHGSGVSVQFGDTVAAQVIEDMGGWQALGDMKTQDVPFREREYCKRYAGYVARGGKVDHDGLFIGIYDHQNLMNGFLEHVKAPVPIGQVTKLLAITDRRGKTEAIGQSVKKLLAIPRQAAQDGRGGALLGSEVAR